MRLEESCFVVSQRLREALPRKECDRGAHTTEICTLPETMASMHKAPSEEGAHSKSCPAGSSCLQCRRNRINPNPPQNLHQSPPEARSEAQVQSRSRQLGRGLGLGHGDRSRPAGVRAASGGVVWVEVSAFYAGKFVRCSFLNVGHRETRKEPVGVHDTAFRRMHILPSPTVCQYTM